MKSVKKLSFEEHEKALSVTDPTLKEVEGLSSIISGMTADEYIACFQSAGFNFSTDSYGNYHFDSSYSGGNLPAVFVYSSYNSYGSPDFFNYWIYGGNNDWMTNGNQMFSSGGGLSDSGNEPYGNNGYITYGVGGGEMYSAMFQKVNKAQADIAVIWWTNKSTGERFIAHSAEVNSSSTYNQKNDFGSATTNVSETAFHSGHTNNPEYNYEVVYYKRNY
jgi:hypothetical protein